MTDAVTAPVVTEPVVAPAAPVVVAPAISEAVTTPPVVAPVVAPPAVADEAVEVVLYEETGDPGLDLALAFVGNLGIGVNHPAMQAAFKGDYSLMEAHLASLGDKATGWEKHIALAKAADQKAADARIAKDAAVTAAAVKASGGDAQWKAIQEWSVANADAEEKAAINKMFDDGPVSARIAATAMRVAYNAATGTVINPANPLRDMSGGTPTGNGALSPAQYANEVASLRKAMGRSFETSPEYAALRARLRP